jgi:cell division protein FtsX
MERMSLNLFLSRFLGNIIWLNLKKMRVKVFWRILLVLINFMLFFASTISIEWNVFLYLFVIVTLANTLFIYIRVYSEKETVIILRSIGASKAYIIFDHIAEILIEMLIAGLLFAGFIALRKVHVFYLLFAACQPIILFIFSPLFSLRLIFQIEKERINA